MCRFGWMMIISFYICMSIMLCVHCGKDSANSSSPEDLVGTWELSKITVKDSNITSSMTPEQADIFITLVIRSDYTFTIVQMQGESSITYTGTWNPSENKATFTAGDDIIVAEYSVSGNILTLSFWAEDEYLILKFTK